MAPSIVVVLGMKPVSCFIGAALLVGWASPLMAIASSTAPSTPFALISPDIAGRLGQEIGTPEARLILKEADAGLTKTPSPMPRVHTEGTLPHEGIHDESALAEKDWQLMRTFALAYRLTGDSRYLQATDRFISAWLDVYQISFDSIDETHLEHIIFADDLTRSGLSQSTQQKLKVFLHTLAVGYLDKIEREKKGGDAYNWKSHRVKLVTLAAYALGDVDLIARAREAFQKQMAGNIKPGGMVVDFPRRDALHYVVYDLEPLSTAALAAKAHGEDWFHIVPPGGACIAQAIDWLTPYALGEKLTRNSSIQPPPSMPPEPRLASKVSRDHGSRRPASNSIS